MNKRYMKKTLRKNKKWFKVTQEVKQTELNSFFLHEGQVKDVAYGKVFSMFLLLLKCLYLYLDPDY